MVSSTAPLPAPAALAAFLRGCERRGVVFAELQCGDAGRGELALAAALRAFRAHASDWAMADWPVRFWTLLAATPQLRTPAAGANWPPALHALAAPAAADRAALLLRLAAGLQEAEAAQALGIDSTGYRAALARACPRDATGQPDAAAWRQLADAIQQHLRELAPDRLARLARLRDEALSGARVPVRPATAAGTVPQGRAARASRRRWIGLTVVLLLLALLAAATWFWPWLNLRPQAAAPAQAPAASGPVSVESLAPPDAPALRFDDALAAPTHPDFDLLNDPEEVALAQQADFLAWYAANAQTGVVADAAPGESDDARR